MFVDFRKVRLSCVPENYTKLIVFNIIENLEWKLNIIFKRALQSKCFNRKKRVFFKLFKLSKTPSEKL